MKYYSAIRMNELLIQTTWMNLKIIMLSKRSKTKEYTLVLKCRFYYYSGMVRPTNQMTAPEKIVC